MKHLVEALSKSMIKKIDKHKIDLSDIYYIVFPDSMTIRDLRKEFKSHLIQTKSDDFLLLPKYKIKGYLRANPDDLCTIFEIPKNIYSDTESLISDFKNDILITCHDDKSNAKYILNDITETITL